MRVLQFLKPQSSIFSLIRSQRLNDQNQFSVFWILWLQTFAWTELFCQLRLWQTHHNTYNLYLSDEAKKRTEGPTTPVSPHRAICICAAMIHRGHSGHDFRRCLVEQSLLPFQPNLYIFSHRRQFLSLASVDVIPFTQTVRTIEPEANHQTF